MTATKPVIFENAVELIPDNNVYFEKFNRVILKINHEKQSLISFAEEFKQNFEEKSYLIICNTINQSLELFNLLSELNPYYLSTNLLPVDRNKVLNSIEDDLKEGKSIVVVSTQVIEAGVDLDFDVVIRDFAQLDSIIQSAGRCNRNNNKGFGDVRLVNLINEKGKSFSSFIYSNSSIEITKKLFKNKTVIEEKEFFSIISEYFSLLKKNKSNEISEKFIESIKTLNFNTENSECPIEEFALIKNNPGYIDVFLRVNEEAENIFKSYLEIKKEDFTIRKEKYLEIKSKMSKYFLSIPEKYYSILEISKDNSFFPNLSKEACDEYYDSKLGFKRNKKYEEDYFVF